ncbi:hypothetical protein NHH88_05960 [Oxalobacteraceae bacterium OTU3CAMAD1]|nr:hypothetical protein NHH88_05960 [Oxalobacteraceae bacterium OTU3CAMAD1]
MTNENDIVTSAGAIDPPPLVPMTAAIKVSVTVDNKKYELAVGIPTSTNGVYTFHLTEEASGGSTPAILADFKFKDNDNFLVNVDMPPITGGGVSLTAGFHLSEGII